METFKVEPSGRKPLVLGNLKFLPSDYCDLTSYELDKARTELGETDENIKNCLEDLKRRFAEDRHVRYRSDDAYLLRFLRIRKFNSEKAFKTIQDFYVVRKKHPKLFSLPPNLESLLRLGFFDLLPYSDEEGRLVSRLDIGKWNTAEVSFEDILWLMIIVSDMMTLNPRIQVNGIIGIWDMKGLTASHLAQFLSPGRILLFFKILQGCVPWRMKMIVGVNCGKLSRAFYAAVQPFVKTKIIERVILLGSDMSELHKYVNPAILPKNLGGELEENECSNAQRVLNNLKYLEYERSFGYL